ncbi:MAG: hypothetical protein JXR83_13185 [Deltaproteobacteria bacterium]|nr:hypothetical protein [Deltaproteobacteria bacterium]
MATQQLTFEDHDAFHHEVIRGAIGGAVGGLGIYAFAALSYAARGYALNDLYAPIMWSAPYTLLAIGAAIGFSGDTRKKKLLRALGGLAAAIVPTAILFFLLQPYPVFAWALAGLGFGLTATLYEGGGARRLFGVLLGIPALLLAAFAGLRFGGYLLAHDAMPAPIATTLAGTIAGFVAVAIGGARRLTLVRDPVDKAFKKAEATLRGELLKHATQAKRVYDQILDDLGKRQVEKVLQYEIRDRSKELCLSLFETAMRWQAIQGDTINKSEADVRSRIDSLLSSAANAKDPVAREQYQRAAKSLEEQLAYLASIGRGQERTVARIVAQLALLEKVRFSLVNFHATDSERLADELRNVSRELETLTSDVDIIGEAIRQTGALPPAEVKESLPEDLGRETSTAAPTASAAEDLEKTVPQPVVTSRGGDA